MTPEAFRFLATLVKDRSGIVLTPDKLYLLESRLMPLATKRGLKSLEDLVHDLKLKRDEAFLRDIVEAMTTNESSFFRDQKPFDQFRSLLLPRLLTANAARKTIRIWSAASSSGQEAYSLAMICADEAARLAGWRVEIIGTDLSLEMVQRASTGIYTRFEVQRGLPVTHLVKHFKQVPDGWQISDALRQMVRFQEGNLLTGNNVIGKFDVIFCRNVLIYFDVPTKAKVLDTVAAHLAPGGTLLLGGSETMFGVTSRFVQLPDARGLYGHAEGPVPAAVDTVPKQRPVPV